MIPRELFRKIRQIEIRTRGLVAGVFGGEYHSAFKGRGIAFAEVRPYQIGDDIRTIDWNVSARTGETHVKVFEEEREQTLLLAVDVSASEGFGSRGTFKRDLAAELCAVVAFSAIRNNDKVGLLLFTDRVERFVPPQKGRRHVLRIIRDLFAFAPTGHGTDFGAALQHVLRVLHRRSIVILVSDFLADGYEPALRAVARRHDTIAFYLQDERDADLPAVGLLRLTDAETGETLVLDSDSPRVRQAVAARARARREATIALLRRLHVDTAVLRTGERYVEPLIAFFRSRIRGRR